MKLAKSIRRTLAKVLAAAAPFLFASTTIGALELSIVETGTAPSTTIALWALDLGNTTFSVNQLVSPTGDVFTANSPPQTSLALQLLRNFDSLSAAVNYVAGTWQATPVVPIPQSPTPYQITIGAISPDSINRVAPTLLAPSPNAVIKNGTSFNLDWDYLTTSGDAPDQTSIITVPQFNPLPGRSRSVFSTPTASDPTPQFSITGGGRFTQSITSVLGTDENRFLMTMTAATADLPLDVEITLGSFLQFDDKVSITGAPSPPFRIAHLHYSRQTQPFHITLSTVPEAPTIGLAVALIVGAMPLQSRRRIRPAPRIAPAL